MLLLLLGNRLVGRRATRCCVHRRLHFGDGLDLRLCLVKFNQVVGVQGMVRLVGLMLEMSASEVFIGAKTPTLPTASGTATMVYTESMERFHSR